MQIKKIIYSKIKKISKKEFNENSLIKNLNLDSLDIVEMITEAEEELKIKINDEELMNVKTVGDVIKLITKSIKKEKKND